MMKRKQCDGESLRNQRPKSSTQSTTKYDVIETIGKGSFGEVDLLVDPITGKQVVSKTVKIKKKYFWIP